MSASSLSGHFDRLRKNPLSGRKQTWRRTASCHFCFSSFALRSSISRNKLPIGLLGSLRRMGPHFFSNSRLASASGPVPYIKRSSSSKSVFGSFLMGLSFWSPGAYVGPLSCRVLSFPAKNLAAMAQGRDLNKHSQKKQARGSIPLSGVKRTSQWTRKMSANDPKRILALPDRPVELVRCYFLSIGGRRCGDGFFSVFCLLQPRHGL
jgi:hypothetical protein